MINITRGCKEKSLLIYLEHKVLHKLDRGFTLYKQFYTSLNVVSGDVNISSLERKPGYVDGIFKHLYNYSDPEATPAGFSVTKQADLQRLAAFVKKTIIIFRNDSSQLWFCSRKSIESEEEILQFVIKDNELFFFKRRV